MSSRKHDALQWIAAETAPLMFWLSLTFLVFQSILVVLWVDVPNLRENLAIEDMQLGEAATHDLLLMSVADGSSESIEMFAIYGMLLIWPIVIAESILHWLTRPWNRETRSFHFYSLLFCICPSLRMCARSLRMGKRIWLPELGWRKADARMRRRLERRLSMPMIGIAMLIMPVLLVELFMKTQVADYRWLRFALHFSTGFIWFCFAAEFILMVSIAEKKLAYCKTHWIDLAIIFLPLVSFLRSLRLLRATGITKMLRLSQLNQVARVYRLRGTALKALRALVLIDFLERVISPAPEKSLLRLRLQLAELEREAKRVRRKITKLERESRESCDENVESL
ncbi:potassium channel protein [Novipirellula artificiosorum]|uniref:Potassium channel protein n=1 Tax=Novipirellula artificiosorum TaxID=2528016 RepID=A0A5C6DG55_9BACT|nr:potassium channel protein [Novipirellula artificiosorum]TWU34964.1 hypothetical protein Poly41_41080 [Novipirellula artificiosorum]